MDGMEITENMELGTPIYGYFIDSLSHILGLVTIDSPQEWLTQRRSQVRVLFRPPFYPHLWGFLFLCGHMWGWGHLSAISWCSCGAILVQLIKLYGRDQLVYFLGSFSLHARYQVAIHI